MLKPTVRIRARDKVLKDEGAELASFAIKKSLEDKVPIFTIPQSGSVLESSAGYPLTYFIDFALMFNYPEWMRRHLGKVWGDHKIDLEEKYSHIKFGSIVAPLWRDQMPAWATWAYLQKESKEDFEEFYERFPLFVSDSNGKISNPLAFISENSRKTFQNSIKDKTIKVICPKVLSPQVSALTISMDEPPVVGFRRDKVKGHGTKRIVECATINEGDKIYLVEPLFDTNKNLPESYYNILDADLKGNNEIALPVAIENGVKVKRNVTVEGVIGLHIKIPNDKDIVNYTPGLKVTKKDFYKDKKVACVVDVATTGSTLEKLVLNLKNYDVTPDMCLAMMGFERIWEAVAGCKMRVYEEGRGTYSCTLITERELFDSAIENWPELAQRIAIETVLRDKIGLIRNNPEATNKANEMFTDYLTNYPFNDINKLKELQHIANENWRRYESQLEPAN